MQRIIPVVLAIVLALPVAAVAQNATALVKQGRASQEQGKVDDAERLFRQALEADPASFDALMAIGIVLDLKGEYEEARAHLAKAIEEAPDGAREQAVITLAISYAFEARALEAANQYEDVFDAQVALEESVAAAATANAIGRIFLEAGDAANAYKWYERGHYLAGREAEQPEAELLLWDLRWQHAQARIAARTGDAELAATHVAEFEKLMKARDRIEDDRAIYQYLLGYVALYTKQYDRAIRELSKGSMEDPFITNLLGMAYEGKGDSDNARKYYEQTMTRMGHSIQNAYARPHARERLAALR